MIEEWKGVVGHEEYYEVSNLGKLRNTKTKRVRKLNLNEHGYPICGVSLGSREKKSTWLVHRKTAEAFISNPHSKPQVNHKDGVKTNSLVTNLEWVTASENMIHAVETGLLVNPSGEDNSSAKVTRKDVSYIRENYKPRCRIHGTRGLGRMFNISHQQVRDILSRKYWT